MKDHTLSSHVDFPRFPPFPVAPGHLRRDLVFAPSVSARARLIPPSAVLPSSEMVPFFPGQPYC